MNTDLKKDFKFYPTAFDPTRPPPSPPNRDFKVWPFAGRIETKDSKKRTAEYEFRLNEYEPQINTDFTDFIKQEKDDRDGKWKRKTDDAEKNIRAWFCI